MIWFALAQVALIALLHFGELDWFWFGALELVWVTAALAVLFGKWVDATWGKGV